MMPTQISLVQIFHTAGRGVIEALIFAGGTNVLLTRFDPKLL